MKRTNKEASPLNPATMVLTPHNAPRTHAALCLESPFRLRRLLEATGGMTTVIEKMAWHDLKTHEARAEHVLCALQNWDEQNGSRVLRSKDWNEARDILTALREDFPDLPFMLRLSEETDEILVSVGHGGFTTQCREIRSFVRGFRRGSTQLREEEEEK